MKTNKGFTLIEMLIVVLIIGILAAIAVPKYQLAVEKSIMQEAIVNLKAIAQANDVFYLQNGRYANAYEIDKLDISIPGRQPYKNFNTKDKMAIQTKNFEYRPDGDSGTPGNPVPNNQKAIAQRKPRNTKYYLYITRKNLLKCKQYSSADSYQTKLCDQINRDGHL